MSLSRRSWLAGAGSLALSAPLWAATSEWPTWRGPKRDGQSPETGLLKEWPEGGPPLAWRIDNQLGNGYSSVSIGGGKIFTMGKVGGREHVLALDLKDGRELWRTPTGGGGNPNCTPTIDGELVYALGRDGHLVCCQVDTGRLVWSKHFEKDFGGKMMSGWGYSESPLVDSEKLIVTPGGIQAMVAALDKKTGKPLWGTEVPSSAAGGAAYSSVVISNATGVKQYVQLIGRGIIGVDAKTGRGMWSYERIANGTANIPTPIVKGDFVFCSTGYGTGAALLKILKRGREFTAQEVYFLEADKMQNHHGGMVLLGDHIYCGHGHNNGFPLCVEMMTGKIAWKPGRGVGSGSAAVVYADSHLYFRYESGHVALVEATPAEYRLKGHFKPDSHHDNEWPHPVIAGGKLYLRDQGTLLVYDISKA